ncbi:NUDIX domain-containing protein [Caballeronia sp. BR00000012568055]|uniref:NUDIX domain-containing protein n=1 Tax=Caballeronia sp. BR00000012568055 TaxID=2918761 RepID=UPI0023F6E338|nr:NUDIX domain-containing protein [Caballeronia sp. BR00000012568055]
MRIRATVLLTRHHAVLLVRERGGMWLLPGASVGMDELPMVAAIRGLHRDTGVEASAVVFQFQQVSAQHLHSVYRVAIADDVDPRPSPLGEYDEVRWVDSSELGRMQVTPGTRAILNRALGPSPNVEDTRGAWRPQGVRMNPRSDFRKG